MSQKAPSSPDIKSLILCVGFAVSAAVSWRLQYDFFERTKVVEGRIAALTYGAHKATVLFDVDGQRYSMLVSRLIGSFETGDPVEIRYDPARVGIGNHGAELNEFASLWGISALLSVAALLTGLSAFHGWSRR